MRSYGPWTLLGLTVIAILFTPPSCLAQGYTITTAAGGADGTPFFVNDGGPATSAFLYSPSGIALDAVGNLYIADDLDRRIREVNANGVISTIAGGENSLGGDGGTATSAGFIDPTGGAVDAAGNFYIADNTDNRLRKVDANGIITTVAGGGRFVPGAGIGDGGPATSAILSEPQSVALDAAGNLYIADYLNFRVREVTTDGNITTVAGCGVCLALGDGGPGTKAFLNGPLGVAVDVSGNLYIADSLNNRIRMVAPNGTITTVAGNGAGSYLGDGGPATQAGLNQPQGVAVDMAGNIYIADTGDNRIRMVTPDGTITTIAGNGSAGYSGDGGPATSAQLYSPWGIAVSQSGAIYFADTKAGVVRMLTPAGSAASTN